MAEKLAVRRPRNDQNRGYIPYGEETLARMHGGDTPPDYKEVFAIGPDDVPATPYYTGPLAYPDFAPNLWPAAPITLRRTCWPITPRWSTCRGCWRGFTPSPWTAGGFFAAKLTRHASQPDAALPGA